MYLAHMHVRYIQRERKWSCSPSKPALLHLWAASGAHRRLTIPRGKVYVLHIITGENVLHGRQLIRTEMTGPRVRETAGYST